MNSSIITPFRWYDKYYKQHRFDVECQSVCDFELITDHRHLLPFQIKRTPSPYTITDWVLRKCCNDAEEQLLSEAAQNFVTDWSIPGGAWEAASCGGVRAITESGWGDASICYNGLTVGKTYTLTFNIAQYLNQSGGGTITLEVYNGATLLDSFTAGGFMTVSFTATDASLCFAFVNNNIGDVLILQHVQITQAFEVAGDDVVLDETMLYLKAYTDFDMISYCGADLGLNIAPGCYYSIIKDEAGNLLFSEVITVKNFLPECSPYIILEWYNSCDFTDVVYRGSNGCVYKNKLYLPIAVLNKPDYPITEEGEEDGNQTFNPTFQKWQKIVALSIYKVPEFIVDALTAIRLHDNIKYYYPLRKKQITIDSAVEIKSVEHNIEYVIDDCFANVDLRMLLFDQFVDETCCNNLSVACKTCSKTIPELDVFDTDYEYALITNGETGSLELQQYVDNEWVVVGEYVSGSWVSDVSEVGDIICDDSKGEIDSVGAWQIQASGIVYCPLITSAVFTTGQTWLFIGNMFTGALGQIEYSTDNGSTWIPVLPKFTQSQLSSGIALNLGITQCCTFLTRIKMYDLNGCQYGYSASYTTPGQTSSCC